MDRLKTNFGAGPYELSVETAKIQFYRQRAKELRADAEQLQAIETKETLIGLAANYEKMAEELEKRPRNPK